MTTKLYEVTEYMGFMVEPTDEKWCGYDVAYLLHGKRGATYRLVRYPSNSGTMFVLNGQKNISNVKGNYYFTDRNGKLEATR